MLRENQPTAPQRHHRFPNGSNAISREATAHAVRERTALTSRSSFDYAFRTRMIPQRFTVNDLFNDATVTLG
jgi:hypothetical protein